MAKRKKPRTIAADELQLMIDLAENTETDDRTVAIVCVAHIEDALADLLRANLPGLTDDLDSTVFAPEAGGPLATFGYKVAIAQALDFITIDFATELRGMAKIRNQFAHKLSVDSFDHDAVSGMVHKLTSLRNHSALILAMLVMPPDVVANPTTRRRFVYSAVTAAVALNGEEGVALGLMT